MAGNRYSMEHLNGNMLASVSIKTTGITPFYHEIVSISILPLNEHFEPNKKISPFGEIYIRPTRVENIDWKEKNDILTAPAYANIDTNDIILSKKKITDIAAIGIDSFKTAELLESWFDGLGLRNRKKLSVIAYNWKYEAPFLTDMLGGPLNFDYIFDSKFRDITSTALFLNDYADWHNKMHPFPKIHMKYLCSQLKIIHEHTDDTLQDCLLIAEIYKRMLSDSLVRYPVYDPEPLASISSVLIPELDS